MNVILQAIKSFFRKYEKNIKTAQIAAEKAVSIANDSKNSAELAKSSASHARDMATLVGNKIPLMVEIDSDTMKASEGGGMIRISLENNKLVMARDDQGQIFLPTQIVNSYCVEFTSVTWTTNDVAQLNKVLIDGDRNVAYTDEM